MTRGRKRKHDPSIPAHIDQAKLPRGCWWDSSGNGRWYTRERREGVLQKVRLAGPNARLSELHTIMEQRAGVDRGSVRWCLQQFHESGKFKALSPRTRRDYDYLRKVACAEKTKVGKFGDLPMARVTRQFMQRLLDVIAEATPTKANQLLRYLRRSFRWCCNRGFCESNPCAGLEQAKERRHRVVPEPATVAALAAFALERGQLVARTKGSCAPYLWPMIEITYMCRLRPIETMTLTDANAEKEGVRTNRTKGSRDSLVLWTPRLRAAWDAALAIRERVWNPPPGSRKPKRPVPIRPEQRPLFVSEDGTVLAKSSLETAWQRLIVAAIDAGKITKEQRFGMEALKHRGITDTPGTRGEKQLASGHKTEAMLDVYDRSVPRVQPADSTNCPENCPEPQSVPRVSS